MEELFLREQLQQKEMALEQEQLGKSQFIKKITSDFEKPIEQLIQFSHMSLLRLKRNELTYTQNYLAEMKMISEELLLHLNELREIALLKTGEGKFSSEEIDVRSLLKEIQKKFTPISENAKVALSFYIQQGESYIMGDYQKLMKVISIILSNFIHRNAKNSRIEVKVTHQEDILFISFLDQGSQIDEKFLHQYYFDIESAQERKTIPGFSLSVCKELMIGQKGDIELSFDKDYGNKIILSLPKSKNF